MRKRHLIGLRVAKAMTGEVKAEAGELKHGFDCFRLGGGRQRLRDAGEQARLVSDVDKVSVPFRPTVRLCDKKNLAQRGSQFDCFLSVKSVGGNDSESDPLKPPVPSVRHAFDDLGAITSAVHEPREAGAQRRVPTNHHDLAAHRGCRGMFREGYFTPIGACYQPVTPR